MGMLIKVPQQQGAALTWLDGAVPATGTVPVPEIGNLYQRALHEHRALFGRMLALEGAVAQAAALMTQALEAGHKLMFCGNGGSAADSQHLAAELTGRFVRERRALAALALTTDTSALTCIANDYDFDQVFERQVCALGRAGDCLIGISTSGKSPNLLRAFAAARGLGLRTIGLLGRDGGALAALSDVPVIVPGQSTARIQEAHIFIGHSLCALVEEGLGLA
jgi:D-sedoheptulose 7-phosphate isomerase